MRDIVKTKLKHLVKNFGFRKDELIEIEKMYCGQFFSPNDKAYLRLLDISKELCQEYTMLNGKLGIKPSLFKTIKNYFRKCKIVDLLFPIHGIMSGVGENISVIIGCVDFLGCGYINRKVIFSPYSLVTCKNYTIFGINIEVGNSLVEVNEEGNYVDISKDDNLKKADKIRLGKIDFGSDTWICAGVHIDNNVSIGDGTTIGAGARVESSIENDCLAIGRPAIVKCKVGKNYDSVRNFDNIPKIEEVQEIRKHIKSLGFGLGGREYYKSINGKLYNTTSLSLGRLFILTHRLCSVYNNPETSEMDKQKILDIIFYKHGQNLKVGGDLFVDLIGTIKIGDNVTIGDSVYMSGSIVIKNGAKVGNNVLMFATGHELTAKRRRVGFSFKYGMYEFSVPGYITIENDISIGENVVICPSTIVGNNIEPNILVSKNKIIK